MEYYRFHLQKYRHGSKISCPRCGKRYCFVRYIDEEGEYDFPLDVGKCDHEQSCGYHYTPRDYFHDNPGCFKNHNGAVITTSSRNNDYENRVRKAREAFITSRIAETSYIPDEIFKRSCASYDLNPLYKYLSMKLGVQEVLRLFDLYHIGTSRKWGGSTVYWQVDICGKVRTGKIMSYDPQTGHRIKEPRAYVSWAHAELKIPDFNLRQCLFGEHLLNVYPSYPIILVESEKTVIIMSHFIQDCIWLATGGKNGCFNSEAMKVLQGRDVTLMPDLGATELWKEKASMLSGICLRVHVSDMLEKIATEADRSSGLDIADYILMTPSSSEILEHMISKNPYIKDLIAKLKLKIVV